MKKREFIKTSTIGIAALASLKLGSGNLIANSVTGQFASTLKFSYESGNFQKVFSKNTFEKNLSVYTSAAQSLNKNALLLNQTPKRARYILTHSNKFSPELAQQASLFHNQKIFLKQFSNSSNNSSFENAIIRDLNKTYGSVENLQNKFIDFSEKLNDQAYVWLVLDKENQFCLVTTLQDKSALSNDFISNKSGFPVLGMNLYNYSTNDYNSKSEYIQAVFDNLDWNFVDQRYTRAKKFNRA